MHKHYVLDTNIILEDPQSMLNGFEDNTIVLTATTLQELDRKKESGGEVGYKARECCRILDDLRRKGDLLKGVDIPSGGKLRVEPSGVDQQNLPSGYSLDRADNRILSTCVYLAHRYSSEPVVLVSNDISMRVNASICGVAVETYRNSIVEDTGYTGHRDEYVDGSVIDALYHDGSIELPDTIINAAENEFVTLHSGMQSALSVHRGGVLQLIKNEPLFGGITPLNAMQSYAIWALRAPVEEIPLVILMGPAGTEKTFLSLAVGLTETYTDQHHGGKYQQMIILRPIAESFGEVGFLPGNLYEKLEPTLAPFMDNIETIFQKAHPNETRDEISQYSRDIFQDGTIDICGLSFIRGRSLNNRYLICDEAQNASQTLIRDVITRAGIGTKVVLCGDPNQIDVPNLDKRTNGLTMAATLMQGIPECAFLKLSSQQAVRSRLSKIAVERMVKKR